MTKFRHLGKGFISYNRNASPEAHEEYMKNHGLHGLGVLSATKKGRLLDLGFLPNIKSVRSLNLQIPLSHDISFLPLKELSQLKELSISFPPGNSKIELDWFPELERLSVEDLWHDNQFGRIVMSPNRIKKLDIEEFRISDLSFLKYFNLLETIRLKTLKLASLTGIEHCPGLKKIELILLNKLRSIDAIRSLPNLEELEITNCKKITDWESLGQINSLDYLGIIGCKSIPSVNFLSSLSGLKAFQLLKTIIEDRDVSPLVSIPELVVQPKDGYEMSLIPQNKYY